MSDDNTETRDWKFYAIWTIKIIQYLYSGAFLAFSIAVIMTGNPDGKLITGPGAIVLFWVLIIWLSIMEGGQNALVGLQPIDKQIYAKTHRATSISTKAVHKGNNMERFIVGRQLLVVVVVFLINSAGSIKTGCSDSFYVSDWLSEIFCKSGLALVFITIILGQLTTQIISSKYMLDFINNYLMVLTSYIALAIEFSGILHSVYLIQMAFMKLTGTKAEKESEELSLPEKVFYWFRVLCSLLCLSLCMAVVIHEIVMKRTTMWAGVPAGVSIFIYFGLMSLLGMMEGMQIALFAVLKMDQEKLKATRPIAHANCELTFRGNNLASFLVGRQIFVTVIVFVIARVGTVDKDHPDFADLGMTTFGVDQSTQDFINTGLLSALITTIIGSLAWRVVASAAPVLFLSNPVINILIRMCLFLEMTGVMNFSFFTAKCVTMALRSKTDDYYLKAAPRAAVAVEMTQDRAVVVTKIDEEAGI